jgi:hypothetical protein
MGMPDFLKAKVPLGVQTKMRKEVLGNWMREHKAKNWVLGCHFVQLSKNTRDHLGVGSNLYALQYGQTCRRGITCLPVDLNILMKLNNEDDLQKLLKSLKIVDANQMMKI